MEAPEIELDSTRLFWEPLIYGTLQDLKKLHDESERWKSFLSKDEVLIFLSNKYNISNDVYGFEDLLLQEIDPQNNTQLVRSVILAEEDFDNKIFENDEVLDFEVCRLVIESGVP